MDTGILLEHLPSRPQGFAKKNIIYGVNTEVDSVLYDTHEMIDEKVKYVCESKLGGVFSWRIDNDNRNEKGGKPTFSGVKQIFQQMQLCTGCKYDTLHGWKCVEDHRWHAPPVVAAYLGVFNKNIKDDSFLESIPFDSISRVYLAFVHRVTLRAVTLKRVTTSTES